jgi:hypothetical protein
LFTANVLSEKEVFVQTKTNGERIRTDTLIHLNNALNLIELSTRSNQIPTELNTNYVYGATVLSNDIVYNWHVSNTVWYWTVDHETISCHCYNSTCSSPSGFYFLADISDFDRHTIMVPQKNNAAYLVPGFVGSCTPLEAVLQATFVCLYDIECIKKLVHYFPPLAQVRKGINRKIILGI